jgi:hypothetical protein
MAWTEIAGFVTGAVCVWLVVIRSIWNFPVGIANNVFFIWLFANAGLYADAALQFAYISLAFVGWYSWIKGGAKHTGVVISEPTVIQLIACIAGVGVITRPDFGARERPSATGHGLPDRQFRRAARSIQSGRPPMLRKPGLPSPKRGVRPAEARAVLEPVVAKFGPNAPGADLERAGSMLSRLV